MITEPQEKLIREKLDEIWRYIASHGAMKKGTTDEQRHSIWEAARFTFGLIGISGQELKEFVQKIQMERARAAKAKKQKLSISAPVEGKSDRDRLQQLQDEQKLIEKEIKEIKSKIFRGKYFRVRIPAYKKPGYRVRFCLGVTRNEETIIKLDREEANRLAEKLEKLWETKNEQTN